MRDYRVKLQPNKVLTFKYKRALKACIYKDKDGRFHCQCAFHGSESIGATYDDYNEAVKRTIVYLDSLTFLGETTFNGSTDTAFIYNIKL